MGTPLSPPPRAATPTAFARVIAEACRRVGRDPAPLLAAAQITPSDLAMADGRVTARQFELLSGAAMQALDDEALGALRRRLPWGSYGMLARASITSPDLALALKRWCRHHALLTDDILLRLEEVDGRAAIRIDEHPVHAALPAGAREFSLVHVLRNIHGLACWMVDSRIALREARFPFDAPPHADAFAHMFPGRLVFAADAAELRFDSHYLRLPLRRDEAALRQMLQRALPLTVLQYRRDRLLVQQVRRVLRAHPALTHNAEEVAALLHLSSRSLHRQLREEGASLQGLKDEARSEQARELLLRTSRPVKQVAAAVGFRNEKSFIRAFRSWTGASPSEFREAATSTVAGPP